MILKTKVINTQNSSFPDFFLPYFTGNYALEAIYIYSNSIKTYYIIVDSVHLFPVP